MELYVNGREEWRKWLEKHHSSEQYVWLVYYKKASGKPGISYNESVEEALCFGWIDGMIKKINDDYYVRRFCPRRPVSKWSVINIRRARHMLSEGRMTRAGQAFLNKVLENPDLVYNSQRTGNFEMPADLKSALEINETAINNFMKLSASRKRLYILWLENAKRDETRKKRLLKILEFAGKNEFPSML